MWRKLCIVNYYHEILLVFRFERIMRKILAHGQGGSLKDAGIYKVSHDFGY